MYRLLHRHQWIWVTTCLMVGERRREKDGFEVNLSSHEQTESMARIRSAKLHAMLLLKKVKPFLQCALLSKRHFLLCKVVRSAPWVRNAPITRYSATAWWLPRGTFCYVNENDHIWEASFWQGEFPLLLNIDTPWLLCKVWTSSYRSKEEINSSEDQKGL